MTMNMDEQRNEAVINDFLGWSQSVAAVKQQLASGKHTMVVIGDGWAQVADIKPLQDEAEASAQSMVIVRDFCFDENGPKRKLSTNGRTDVFAWLWYAPGDTVDKPTVATVTEIVRKGEPVNIGGTDVILTDELTEEEKKSL